MMPKLPILIILLSLINSFTLQSQNSDSLLSVWKNIDEEYTYDQQVEALHKYGMIIKDIDPDSSIEIFEKGIHFAATNNDMYNVAFFKSRIGGAYYVKGVYDKSLEYFSNALKQWQQMDSNKGVIRGLNNVALIYHMVGEDSLALKNHFESVKLCTIEGDSAMKALNYLNMSVIYNDLEMYNSALNYIDSSMAIFKNLNFEDFQIKLTILKGHVFLKMKEYDFAKICFNSVLSNKDYKNIWERCYTIVGLASTEQKSGNINESIKLGLEGLEMAKEINALWDIMYAYEVLAGSYAIVGDYKMAYKYMEGFKSYSDSILSEKTQNRISFLQLKQKEFEYKMLEDENLIQEQKLNRKNTQLVMMVITVIVIMVIVLILVRFSVVKTKLNQELRIKNSEIARKNKELTQLIKTKDTFLKIIGHDLKGPIGLVVSFTDMIMNNYDDITREEIREYLKYSKNSALNAIDLLTNLLDWVKSQTLSVGVKRENINLFELIAGIVDGMKSTLSVKDIHIQINIDTNLEFEIDKNMTTVVIRNIITNAIKFTEEGGEIVVSAQIIEDQLMLSIADNGIGMSEEKLATLFNIDETKSTPGTNSEKGIGIGLILSKDLIIKQGGKIWADSEPGKGSVFHISLPK